MVELESRPLLDSTAIIVTAKHGETPLDPPRTNSLLNHRDPEPAKRGHWEPARTARRPRQVQRGSVRLKTQADTRGGGAT
jgi:hypothetical protein